MDIHRQKKKELVPFLMPFAKMNSKLIIYKINVRAKTTETLRIKDKSKSLQLGLDKRLLDMTPTVKQY